MKGHWLSWGLLVLGYATYGQLLHSNASDQYIWLVTLACIVIKSGILTLTWKPVRDLAIRGFQSDVGYSIMVLVFASLAVLAVVQLRAFAYFIVLVATALLVRVDCLAQGMGDRLSFVTLVLLATLGLGLSWLPVLLLQSGEIAIWGTQI